MARQSTHRQTQSQTQKVVINLQSVEQRKKRKKTRRSTQQEQQAQDVPVAAAAPAPRPPPYTYFPSVQMIQNPSPNAPIPDYIQSGYNSMQRGLENARNDMMNQFNELRDYITYNGASDPATAAQVQQVLDMLQQQMTGSDASTAGAPTDALLDSSTAGTNDVLPSGMTTPTATQGYGEQPDLPVDDWTTYNTPAMIFQPDIQPRTTVNDEPQTPQANLVDAFQGASTSYTPSSRDYLIEDLEDMSEADLYNLYHILVTNPDKRLKRKPALIQRILQTQFDKKQV